MFFNIFYPFLSLIVNKDKTLKKAKDVKAESPVYSDYVKLLHNKDINTAIKTTNKTNWSIEHVVINDKEIILKADSCKKRLKFYDNIKIHDGYKNYKYCNYCTYVQQ